MLLLLLLLSVLVVAVNAATPVNTLASSGQSTLVIQSDGEVFGTGFSLAGQLGTGKRTEKVAYPTKMLKVGEASSVAMGDYVSCIVDKGQVAKCTGVDSYGQLGAPKVKQTLTLVPVQGLSGAKVKQVYASVQSSCALLASGGARCWGYNAFGGLGINTARKATTPQPVTGFKSSGLQAIALGDQHACFLTNSGKLRCAGRNSWGQLGDGTTTNARAPRAVVAPGHVFASVAVGFLHTCAVTAGDGAGEMLCWGSNALGELGVAALGATTTSVYISMVPLTVTGLGSNVVRAGAVGSATFAMLGNGTVMAFGEGYKPFASQLSAGVLQGGVLEVAGGHDTTCVALANGQGVKCQGANVYGQLGVGPSVAYSAQYVSAVPRPVTLKPTKRPTTYPTKWPTTLRPTKRPTNYPTKRPTTLRPTKRPTSYPTKYPTKK